MSVDLAGIGTDELLELLEREGCLVGLTRRRELVVRRAPTWWEAARTPQLETRLRWAVIGRGTGSEWRRCTACRREAMRPRRLAAVKCPLTPKCTGKLERRRPTLAGADGATACARPGCAYAATVTDHAGRPLCRLDHLAQAIADQQGDTHP